MSSKDHEIITEFVAESREHLNDIENQLLAIESAEDDIDIDLVNEVFRAVHSIKGASGFLGFTTLGDLAHNLENVLNLIRNRELAPNAEDTDVLLRAADTLRGMVDDIDHSNDVDIAAHVVALQTIVSGANVSAEASGDILDEMAVAEPNEPGSFESAAQQVLPEMVETTHATSSSPEQGASAVSSTPASSSSESVRPSGNAQPGPKQSRSDNRQSSTIPAETNVRVSVGVLDSLMNLAGELVLSRNQLLQAVGSIDELELASVVARLDQVTSEVQEAIMLTRMQVVGTVFNKFPRVVRDLSGRLGKKCRLTLEGGDVELDKSIIEAIGDPLTHLVRNSVDHGIETPEQRLASGKSETGTVLLRAYHQAGKVNISIRDDGAGIDAAKLREKAVARGILTPERAAELSNREALRLIFHPGFSMAEKVTSVSGRGVGMDVVKTNIERLGGSVEIDTQLGGGTTINVTLPLTLAIIPSLIINCGGKRFAIPQASISELVRIKTDDKNHKIENIKDAQVFRLRGALLPLVRLDSALNLKRGDEGESANASHIIVVETGHLQYGLLVDGVNDSEEIVVKPLGRHMQDCQCLAGATILGNGRVALILDIASIASHCDLTLSKEETVIDAADARLDDPEETQTSLLFTNATDEYFGIPMEVIARLERVPTEQIDQVGGQDILQYRGASLPLLSLEHHIKAKARHETDKIYVVVYSVLGREVGLIVPELVDIRRVSTIVDITTFAEPGVVGSIAVDKNAVRLLDLYALTRVAHPDWFVENEVTEPKVPRVTLKDREKGRVPRVLVVEDSSFFRTQVAGFMKDAGYEVETCEDGQIAWDTIQESDRHFDVVVTDVEMPNMDGCQLAQHIKQDASLCQIPVIALTSLATEQDIHRGISSGIDDYQIKLDREQLMVCVAERIRQSVMA